MQRRFWKVVGGIVATLVLLLVAAVAADFGFLTQDYGIVCTRCLDRYTYIDRSFCGIRYSRIVRSEGSKEPFSICHGEATASFAYDTYEKIFGKPCPHHLIRYGGIGSYSAGLIADGRISTPPGLEVRLGLLARLFEAFDRVPNRALAQETYAMIDHDFPETIDGHAQLGMANVLMVNAVPNEPPSILYRGLSLLRNEADWRTVLDAARKKDGNIPLLKSPGQT